MSDADSKSKSSTEPGLHEVVMQDLKRTKLRRDYLPELRELYRFYLDDERRNELAGMGRIRRAFLLVGWLFKSLLMKLSPARRLLLIVALFFTILGPNSGTLAGFQWDTDFRPWAIVLLLFVLMLELKDKLLAKDEIQVARQVQLALLPEQDLSLPGWTVWSCSRPANDVGGDLVDYLELDGFRHGIVLGDVAGKGLGAALLTAKLQATLRAVVLDAPSLEDLGLRLNTIFHRDGLDNRYATMFFAEIEYDSGHVRYLNAGHNPAFAISSNGIRKLSASSFPLGMLASPSYEEGNIELAPGDMLIAYSDGLTEATDAAGEEFGTDRLEQMLPELVRLNPRTIGGRILREVDEFLGEERATDDLSLAIIVRSQDQRG